MRSFPFIFLLLLNIVYVESAELCVDMCVCRFNNRGERDLIGEYIDCTYTGSNILVRNYALPTTTYSLDLSSNNITVISPSPILKSKTMVELFLNNNEIIEIPNALNLPELKVLDVSSNQIEAVHEDTFKSLPKLEYLNLANNKLTTFTKLTFHRLSNLREIYLDNNNIGPSLRKTNLFDRDGFGLTNKISILGISGVNLNKVPDNFFLDAYAIKKLIISNNNLSDVFELPYTLQYLDLSDNPIEEISSEDFVSLPALKELRLNNLQIKEVPDFVFEPLHDLVSLELERNRNLTVFSKLAFGREVLDDADDFLLEKLSLSGSRVTTLDSELMQPLGMLIKLDLQGNPWRCDCKLVWLKQLQIPPDDYDHVRCASPKPLFNSRIFELGANYFNCPLNKHYVGGAIAATAFCIVLAAIGIWFFLVIPKCYTRGNIIQEVYNPTTAYTVLSVHATRSEL